MKKYKNKKEDKEEFFFVDFNDKGYEFMYK
jgi:hypothetical protein